MSHPNFARPIKVVQICENPIAGAPIALSKALNKWSEGRIQSRHIAASDRNENRIFDFDLLIQDVNYTEIFRTLSDADVIHLHNFYRNQELFRKWPALWDIVMRKKRVWQAHTQRDIGWMSMEDGINDKNAIHLVIAQYHTRMYPECRIVQNIVDITDPLLCPIEQSSIRTRKPRVVFSPSRIRLPGWDSKGYDETVPVLQKLVNEGKISADIVMDVPHKQCLTRKRTGDIGIDEIVTGSYHLCSLETLSQGLITLANLDDHQQATLEAVTGCPKEELPWVCATPQTLEAVLKDLLSWPQDKFHKRQAYSRAWMEKYWHPQIAIRRFEAVYREAVGL